MPDILRQNQIGTKATKNISAMPRPNRCICGLAQVPISPPAMEYSISQPMAATAVITRISASSGRNPCQSRSGWFSGDILESSCFGTFRIGAIGQAQFQAFQHCLDPAALIGGIGGQRGGAT